MTDSQRTNSNPDPAVDGLLGELERDIMEVVWNRGDVSVHEVQEALSSRNPAYTTVMTVMGRLFEKGVLARRKKGRAFIYHAAQDGRRGFIRQQARQQIHAMLAQFGKLAVAEFVDELSSTPEQIEALESLLEEQRRTTGNS